MRNGGDEVPFTSDVSNFVLWAKIVSAGFARCLVMVDKYVGRTLTHVCGAPEVLVFYFKWFG